MTRRRWIVGAAGLVAAAIIGLWLARRDWAICVDGEKDGRPYGFCADGTFSLAAIIGTVALAAALAGYVVAVVRTSGRPTQRRVRAVGLMLLGATAVACFVLLGAPIEEIPVPYP